MWTADCASSRVSKDDARDSARKDTVGKMTEEKTDVDAATLCTRRPPVAAVGTSGAACLLLLLPWLLCMETGALVVPTAPGPSKSPGSLHLEM